jgi:hypothetical protein
MIPNLILKLKNFLLKKNCQTAKSCLTDKVWPKRKKEKEGK